MTSIKTSGLNGARLPAAVQEHAGSEPRGKPTRSVTSEEPAPLPAMRTRTLTTRAAAFVEMIRQGAARYEAPAEGDQVPISNANDE